MAITIQEVFVTDTISNLVTKVNFNFDQLILAGGGPRGLQGLQGLQGVTGPTGRRGENFYIDDGSGISSAPLVGIIVGDNFILGDGTIYEWDGIAWVATATNIRGAVGPVGPSGASLDFDRYVGGNGSTFPLSLSYYPQLPANSTPTPNAKDFITLKRGGLDILYLGDAELAYGNAGALSGISNMPQQPNSAKLWVVQDSLVGGGKNGITIGAAGAKNSLDNPNTYANFEQFANLYIGSDGSFNISMTVGGVTDPKPINISTDDKIGLSGGDIINNVLFVGKDSNDSLIGLFGNLKDKIDLTTINTTIKTNENISFIVDNDLNGSGHFKVTKNFFQIVSPTTQFRNVTSIINNLPISTDANHYSDGFSIFDSVTNESVKFELFKFNTKKYATIGISNSVDEGKNLLISSDGVTLISPKVSYPLTPISTWLNEAANTSIGDGSLSVYRKIRMKNTGGTLTGGLVFAGIDGVFDYASADIGIPGNSSNFAIGMWSREVANNRTYTTKQNDFVNLGDRYVDDTTSMLVLSSARSHGGTPREAKLLLITENQFEIPKITFKNGFETVLMTSSAVNANRSQILPKSAGLGGYLMSFTDNNNHFSENWEEYQVLTSETVPIGANKIKNDIVLNAIGADTGGYVTNPVTLSSFVISGGVENYTYGTTGTTLERRYPSKIHIKRINRDYYLLNFAICLYIKGDDVNDMTLENFNFFEFTFSTTNPGVLKPLRNNINTFDNVGGVWFSGSSYMSYYSTLSNGDISLPNIPLIDFRRGLVTNGTEFARYQQSKQINYVSNWTVDRISTDRFRLQISTASNITKAFLRNGFMFTGSAVVYGYRDTDV